MVFSSYFLNLLFFGFFRTKIKLEIKDLFGFRFENCFLFSKTIRTWITYLIPNFFFVLKKITYKILNSDNNNSFQKTQKLYYSGFKKLFSRTIFENTEEAILVFIKNCFCSLNLMSPVFFVFFRTKNVGKQTCFPCFFCYHCF